MATISSLLVTSRASGQNTFVLGILGVASLALDLLLDVDAAGSSQLLVDLALQSNALSSSEDLVVGALDNSGLSSGANLGDWISLESTWAELEALAGGGKGVTLRAVLGDDSLGLDLDAFVQNAVELVTKSWAGNLEASLTFELVASLASDSDALSSIELEILRARDSDTGAISLLSESSRAALDATGDSADSHSLESGRA